MPFKRSLAPRFVKALNELYEARPHTWWRRLVDAPNVFIALRNGSINAYAGGGSIGKITWENQTVRLRVHIEYLTLAGQENPYVELVPRPPSPISRPVVANADDFIHHLSAIMARPRRFVGRERVSENSIACRRPCVLDMEAAFGLEQQAANPEFHDDDVPSDGGRIDLVSLGQNRLVFTELKVYDNADLRSQTTPAVCSQLVDYHRWLNTNSNDIISAYTDLLCFWDQLQGKFFEKHRGMPEGPLIVDPVPRLLVIGVGGEQLNNMKNDIAPMIVRGVQPVVRDFSEKHIRSRSQARDVTNGQLF